MALELVAGAALGIAFQEFYTLVKNEVKKARMFKQHLESLQSKLEPFNEWVKKIRDLNEVVGHNEKETENLVKLMKEGKDLVEKSSEIEKLSSEKLKCLKIGMWNPEKSKYASKLSNLEKDVQSSIGIFLQLFDTRNGLETLAVMQGTQITANENLAVSKDILKKINEAQNLDLKEVGLSCAVPPPPNSTVGLDVHIEKLKKKLLNEKMPLLVVTGPGGLGKTTLVKKLCRDEEIKGVFKENIFFILVSETPNLKVIAGKLFCHKGLNVPQFQTTEDAINGVGVLFKLIEGPILLIMDDVWPESEKLVDQFKFDGINSQILVTSRIEIGGSRSTYTLPPLNNKDAKTLLYQSTKLNDGICSIPSNHIEKVLRACGGHPLALEVIGRSLRGRSSESWQVWVRKLSKGRLTLGSNSELRNCLQRSLDVLDNETKECFLDLGLFPEDKQIPVKIFVAMWTEFYKLHDGIEAIDILENISFQSLASLNRTRENVTDIDNDYDRDFISQHDLLRELAIHNSSQGPIEQRKRLIVDTRKEDISNSLSKQKSLPTEVQILSITTDKNFSSSWCNIQLSKVEVLVLNFQIENSILSEFLPKMLKLKVLIVTNYGFNCANLVNFRLFEFASYLRKIVLENVSIPSLFMGNTRNAFGNCNMEISNALPNLVDMDIDFCNNLVESPIWLCGVSCLEKLRITRYNLAELPQRFGELTNLEVLRLEYCNSLLGLPESITSLGKLSILKMYSCEKIINLPEHIGDLKDLTVLRIESCYSLLKLPESITSLHELSLLDLSYSNITKLPEYIGELCNLKELHMVGCGNLCKKLPPSTFGLKQLELVSCDNKGAKLWKPIKKELTNLKIKVVPNELEIYKSKKEEISEKIKLALYVQKAAIQYIDEQARKDSGHYAPKA